MFTLIKNVWELGVFLIEMCLWFIPAIFCGVVALALMGVKFAVIAWIFKFIFNS